MLRHLEEVVVLGAAEGVVVHNAERVDRLQTAVAVALVRLLDVGFRRVEQHTLLELVGPVHLHLHNELAALVVFAPHVDYGVLFQWAVWNQLGRQIFDINHFRPFLERQQRIQETDNKVGMFCEHRLESQVVFRI